MTLRGIPSFRRLWTAVAISETGDWLLFIALPVYVFQVSGSAMSTSTVFLAELAPAVVVGTLCGAVIDRRSPAVGVPATAIVTGLITGTQHAAPPSVRGRVLSLIGVSDALGQGTGILVAGLLGSSVSLTLLLDGQASLYLACAIVAGASFAVAPRPALPHRLAVAYRRVASDRSISHHS